MTGSEFGSSIMAVKGEAREGAILQAFLAGHMPDWFTKQSWHPVEVEADIKGVTRRLIYFVANDYFSIGTNADFLRMPARPKTYQTIASSIGAILPSRRIVNAIWGTAEAKVDPNPLYIKGASDLHDTEPFITVNTRINEQLKKMSRWPTTSLVAGDKKDVCIGPGLDGSRVSIYGWHQLNGKPIQPYPGPHNFEHVDYSHGGRMVSRAAFLDGVPVDLASIFMDKDLHVLVSDQGPFPPFFPNTGSGTSLAIQKALALSGPVGSTQKEPVLVEAKGGWGTLEWLSAIAATLGIISFGINHIARKNSGREESTP